VDASHQIALELRRYLEREGLRPGDRIEGVSVPADRPNPFLFAIPAIALLGLIAVRQRTRRTMIFAKPASTSP